MAILKEKNRSFFFYMFFTVILLFLNRFNVDRRQGNPEGNSKWGNLVCIPKATIEKSIVAIKKADFG